MKSKTVFFLHPTQHSPHAVIVAKSILLFIFFPSHIKVKNITKTVQNGTEKKY